MVQINLSGVSSPDAYGRVFIQLNSPSNSYLATTYVVGYIVDAAHMRLILSGDPNNSDMAYGDLGGLALGQGANTGSFTTASVAGSSYVFAAEGRDQTGALQLAGTCTLNTDGTVTGVLNWNDLSGGRGQAPADFTGTYTVDPTGRLTLSNLTDGANFNYSFHLYLDGKGSGLVLANDISDQFTGEAFERQTGPFSANSLSGRYGLSAGLYPEPPTGINSTPTLSGWLTSTPNGASDALSGYADFGDGAYDFALTGTLSTDSSGVFQGQLFGVDGILASPNQSASSTPNSITLFLIDSTQGILIETDKSQLMLGRLQLAQ